MCKNSSPRRLFIQQVFHEHWLCSRHMCKWCSNKKNAITFSKEFIIACGKYILNPSSKWAERPIKSELPTTSYQSPHLWFSSPLITEATRFLVGCWTSSTFQSQQLYTCYFLPNMLCSSSWYPQDLPCHHLPASPSPVPCLMFHHSMYYVFHYLSTVCLLLL